MDVYEKELLYDLKVHMINRNDKAAEQTYSDLRHYQKEKHNGC